MIETPETLDELLDGSSPTVHSGAPGVRLELAALVEAHADAGRIVQLRRNRVKRGLAAGSVTALVFGGGVTAAAAAPTPPPYDVAGYTYTEVLTVVPADADAGQPFCPETISFAPSLSGGTGYTLDISVTTKSSSDDSPLVVRYVSGTWGVNCKVGR